MNIFSRILQFIDHKGISKNKFSNEIGLSNSYMSKMEGSDNVGSKIIEKIVRSYPDISLTWLITGQGEMLKAQTQDQDQKITDMDYKLIAEERLERIEELKELIGALKYKIGQLERNPQSQSEPKRRAG